MVKVNASGNALVFSTYLGGSGNDLGTSIAADPNGNAYVGGYTKSGNFPTANAVQPTNHGGFDAFVTKISGDGSTLLYSTYLGGRGQESISTAGYRDLGIALDSAGSAYVAGTTKSKSFPKTTLAFQKTLKGGADAFVAKISLANATTTSLTSSPNPSIQGQAVTFTATVGSGSGVPPDGEIVTFKQGTKSLGTGSLTNGVAAFTTSSLSVATHHVKAVYGGDANFGGSTSNTVLQVVTTAIQ